MVGRTLGQYEIVERIGAGGMGEVYRARDTRLGRTVAVKVLPEQFAADRERLARFEREARLLASLNHPHIATLYDFEHVDEVYFLAMELVEGEDLAARLARGPMPATEAARVAAQVAQALEVAHESGVIHRDLKPSNIRFAADGNVKVLDFGLAKAVEGDASNPDLSKSPTITAATSAGVILGTAAYMSPEQARGRPVDKRTDIWALGCVLFEMLTARQVFVGDTVSDTIAQILERAPAWDALPAGTPPRVKRILERCLEKDVKRRLRDVGDARIELEDVVADSKVMAAPDVSRSRGGRARALVWVITGLVLGAAVTLAVTRVAGPGGSSVGGSVTRVSVQPPEGVVPLSNNRPAVSANGRSLAFPVTVDNGRRILVRDLESRESRVIADVDATNPFFSPDGRWIGFVGRDESGRRIMRVSVDGGTPLAIGRVAGGPVLGAWTRDGHVIVARSLTSGLVAFPAAGGEPVALTRPDTTAGELGHWAPWVLPDDDHVLFTAWRTRMDDARIKVVSRKTGETRVVVENGASPMYVEGGHLLYVQGATLMCASFDASRVETTGEPVPLIDPVPVQITDGTIAVGVGGNTLCHMAAEGYSARLVWGDAEGHVEPVVPEARDYDQLSAAPDGQRVAVDIEQGGKSDIWVLDLTRTSMTRLTVDGTNGTPVFAPDGKTVTFESMRRGPFELYSIGAGGGTSPQLLFPSSLDVKPLSWLPDGNALLFSAYNKGTGGDIMQFRPADGSVSPFIHSPFEEDAATVSPDGRWVAYELRASDRADVYVAPLGGGDRVQVTVAGGSMPRWARDGRSLYFVGRDQKTVYRVPVTTATGFNAGRPERVLGSEQLGGYVEAYDTHPDGRLILVVNPLVVGTRLIQVELNIDDELRRVTASP